MQKLRLHSALKKFFRVNKITPQVDRSVALKQEIQFWHDWFITQGLQWPNDYCSRFNPDQPIHNHLAVFIDRMETNTVRILDIGAGPITKIGKKYKDKRLIIVPTDLLANEYDQLLANLKIEPLIRTTYADERFGLCVFDIVHGENCIDHMVDPIRVINQMIAVCKPMGYVVLYHEENEGERQNYQQLHKWNCTCENGNFVIKNQQGRVINVTKMLSALYYVECIRDGDKIRTGIQRKS
jgi:SAM-dependent methyltransferase